MFQIDLAANGDLVLVLPGRTLDIPATVGGLEYIKKILKDHHNGVKSNRGYIGTLPTQHAVDKHFADEFLAKKAAKAAEELKEKTRKKFEDAGVDVDKLRFTI